MTSAKTSVTKYDDIHLFEPLYPVRTGELEDIARELVARSSRLEGGLPEAVLNELKELLKIVNSYYSNLIEGDSAHPVDIERAMRGEYSQKPNEKDLQTKSRIHIEVQQKILLEADRTLFQNVTSKDFLCWIHREFHEKMPERLCRSEDETGEKIRIDAGKLRTGKLSGSPPARSLPGLLKRFDEAFRPESMHGLRPIIGLAAAHFYLMRIRPFAGGNSPVTRFFTDAYFENIGLPGYGLWNISRGLALQQDEYLNYLATNSDNKKTSENRENLADRTLTKFCKFLLNICLEQTNYMNEALKFPDLLDRLENYVRLRSKQKLLDEKGRKLPKLSPDAAKLLKELAVRGEIPRGRVAGVINKSERTGRTLIGKLLKEDLLKTRSEKGLIRLGFPAHTAGYYFPHLYPVHS